MRRLTLFLLLGLAATALAAGKRTAAVAKPTRAAPYPQDALSVEGNVVLTGEVTAAGDVKDLKVLTTSSPKLTPTAIETVSRWKFVPAAEDGKPVAITLNAVVRFRKEVGRTRGSTLDPGTLPAPIQGNLILSPAGEKGRSKQLEGFPVEPGDSGIAGILDLDVPKTFSPQHYHIRVTDTTPKGKVLVLSDSTVPGGGSSASSIVTVVFHRDFDPSNRAEAGSHSVHVMVDGKDAGGGTYRVIGSAKK
jgi:protein TonB